MRNLTVELPGRAYDIKIGSGLLCRCGELIRPVTRAEGVTLFMRLTKQRGVSVFETGDGKLAAGWIYRLFRYISRRRGQQEYPRAERSL